MENKSSILDTLKVVILECPYKTISDSFTQNMFMKFVEMKLKGYQRDHSDRVLPLGATDFIGQLVILCKVNGNNLDPMMVFKATSSDLCREFKIPYEMYSLFVDETTLGHKNALSLILDSARGRNINVGYISSWTTHPSVRNDLELKKEIKDISTALIFNHYSTYGMPEVFAGGALRFKVNEFLTNMGFVPLEAEGKILPPIECPFLAGEKTAIMYLNQFSFAARSMGKKYQSLWDSRLTIGDHQDLQKKAS